MKKDDLNEAVLGNYLVDALTEDEYADSLTEDKEKTIGDDFSTETNETTLEDLKIINDNVAEDESFGDPNDDKKLKSKKAAKILAIITVSLFAAVFLFLLGTTIADKILLKKEFDHLNESGLYSPVNVGDYNVNLLKFGNEYGKHRIVTIAGLGMSDLSVTIRQTTKEIEKDNQLIVIDRAGYGLSDDASAPRSVENIVEEYRLALTNANVKKPYVLLPHSIGGAYATYWASKYPEEIEGVFFLDGSQLPAYATEEPEYKSDAEFFFENVAEFLGLERLALRSYHYYLEENYSSNDQTLSDELSVRSSISKALFSESNLIYENVAKTLDELVTNDVPKVYVCASWGFSTFDELVEYLDRANEQMKRNKLKPSPMPSPETIDAYLAKLDVARQEIITPYLEKMGNCKLILLPGSHLIYQQKPAECAKLLGEFLKTLD